VGLRFLAGQLAKILPGPGWVIAGVVTGLGTWAIGEVAALYFETGKRLTPAQLRAQYRQTRRRPRRKAAAPAMTNDEMTK